MVYKTLDAAIDLKPFRAIGKIWRRQDKAVCLFRARIKVVLKDTETKAQIPLNISIVILYDFTGHHRRTADEEQYRINEQSSKKAYHHCPVYFRLL